MEGIYKLNISKTGMFLIALTLKNHTKTESYDPMTILRGFLINIELTTKPPKFIINDKLDCIEIFLDNFNHYILNLFITEFSEFILPSTSYLYNKTHNKTSIVLISKNGINII